MGSDASRHRHPMSDPAPHLLIEERLAWLDAELDAILRGRPAVQRLYDFARYHLGWLDESLRPVSPEQRRRFGGKRLRGVLCFLAGEAVGGVPERLAPAAAAIELIHNFSLVHDDIEDGDAERRHRPTVWKLWGIPHAINCGSHLQAMVNVATLRLAERDVPPATVVAVLRTITDAIVRMTEGQHLDMAAQDGESASLAEYFEMTAGKTGALIEAALRVGAIVGGAAPDRIEALGRFGLAFGIAFQARDDFLGIWGEPEVTGKPVGSDIERGKRSLPIVYALATLAAGSPEGERLRSALRARDVPAVLTLLERIGGRSFVDSIVAARTEEALAALATADLSDNPCGRAIAAIAREALARTH